MLTTNIYSPYMAALADLTDKYGAPTTTTMTDRDGSPTTVRAWGTSLVARWAPGKVPGLHSIHLSTNISLTRSLSTAFVTYNSTDQECRLAVDAAKQKEDDEKKQQRAERKARRF